MSLKRRIRTNKDPNNFELVESAPNPRPTKRVRCGVHTDHTEAGVPDFTLSIQSVHEAREAAFLLPKGGVRFIDEQLAQKRWHVISGVIDKLRATIEHFGRTARWTELDPDDKDGWQYDLYRTTASALKRINPAPHPRAEPTPIRPVHMAVLRVILRKCIQTASHAMLHHSTTKSPDDIDMVVQQLVIVADEMHEAAAGDPMAEISLSSRGNGDDRKDTSSMECSDG